MKEQFLMLLRQTQRRGIEELILYLDTTDFFITPASTKHHGSYPGGLVEHSLAVYDNLIKINEAFQLCLDQESIIICSLLHDLCKANFYKASFRNRKNDENGQWERVQYYEIQDEFPLGHGEKSVVIVQHFIPLNREEMLAIRWHMGSFDDAAQGYGGNRSLSSAMKKHPLVVALHMADMAASYFDEK